MCSKEAELIDRREPAMTVIPIAGGKGGIGKSLFTACLTRYLASTGRVCTAVDLDLGGSNLHSFFGVDNTNPGIGDFLATRGGDLNTFCVSLPDQPNARFIPGDGLRPFLANLSHMHKMRLLREITRLDADVVLLDLGAGSSYNTLDFFRVWGRGILLTTPEYTAIMNLMNFVKNVALRIVAKGSHGNSFMEELFAQLSQQSMEEAIRSLPEVLDEMALISDKRTTSIREQLATLQLDLVVNQVHDPEEVSFVKSVQGSLQKRLGLKVNWQGGLSVQRGARIGMQARRAASDLPDLAGIGLIAERILRNEVVSSETLLNEISTNFNI